MTDFLAVFSILFGVVYAVITVRTNYETNHLSIIWMALVIRLLISSWFIYWGILKLGGF